jgi:hypothetical protein
VRIFGGLGGLSFLVLLPKSWLVKYGFIQCKKMRLSLFCQRQHEKQAAFPKKNRPCRMALSWRSGCSEALPYPPTKRRKYTCPCRRL